MIVIKNIMIKEGGGGSEISTRNYASIKLSIISIVIAILVL